MRLSEIREGIEQLIGRYGDIEVTGYSEGERSSSRVAAWEDVSDLSGAESGLLGEADWAIDLESAPR